MLSVYCVPRRRAPPLSCVPGQTHSRVIKAACNLCKQAIDFVEAARMTGNPTEVQKKRCYLACYNAHADEGDT